MFSSVDVELCLLGEFSSRFDSSMDIYKELGEALNLVDFSAHTAPLSMPMQLVCELIEGIARW
jgi:hypothetical protein